ncbi:adenosylcobinamide-phosphate synthase CbiB [Ponticaulis profundi]|uniref:Cobalamin biosynthesis protein CobD n=1 Tax=Ponticaulis profundi TaxID=2665222 RepID=A0ABW1S7R6_9PROT
MLSAPLMLTAFGLEAALGWPDWLYRRIAHPVVWLGALISALETRLNRTGFSHHQRYLFGALTSLIAISVALSFGLAISILLPDKLWALGLEALIASSLIASRSLYSHVSAIAAPLILRDLHAARHAVSMIVGRDPSQLDEAGIARASLESLAENASDGVIAPLFWGVCFGLPGIAAYKAINTLDSMIGHRSDRYQAFGGFAARLDDLANLIPARLTGILFAAASLKRSAFTMMFRDARKHRSPNAGWPEAAMAGALGVRLSGPRQYENHQADEPWLNGSAPDPHGTTIRDGLSLYLKAMSLAGLLMAVIALPQMVTA